MINSLLLPLLFAAGQLSSSVVVVCPAEFRDALGPWMKYRQQQGYEIILVGNEGEFDELQKRVHEKARETKAGYLLLIGDATPVSQENAKLAARATPAQFVKAQVNVLWGSEPEIATDNGYGDLDGDGVPDLAVGRLPADSPEELGRQISRIIAYEKNRDFGPWRRRVNVIAGVGGFSPLIDGLLETATKKFLTEALPGEYEANVTYGSWQSPFCPDPRKFHEATVARHNEGCLFWVYIGHGQRTYLDRVRVPGATYHILDTRDVKKLKSAGPPIAVMLACYTAAYDHPVDCLAEEMLRAEGGPVAVLGSSRVSMPYAMAVLSDAMLEEYFQQRRQTLGETVLRAKQKLVEEANREEASNRLLLDAVAAAISPSRTLLAEERREHLSLFNLLGDPLLKLQQPAAVKIEAADTIDIGEKLVVTGQCDLPGRYRIELVCRRDRLKKPAPQRPWFDPTHAALVAYDETYAQANDRTLAEFEFDFAGGAFQGEFDIPVEASGPCLLRVHAVGENNFALGSSKVFVRTKQP